jgi:outer membrane protein
MKKRAVMIGNGRKGLVARTGWPVGGGLVGLCLTGCLGAGGSPPATAGSSDIPARAEAASHNGARIAVIDPLRVLEETEVGRKAKESLTNFMKNRQSLIELEEKELKRMEEDLVKQASVLSSGARREREEAFRRRAIEFQQKANELNREIQEKQKEVLESFREKVERVVAKVAQQMGLLVVMEKGRGGPTVYNDSSLDISPQVIEEFNRMAPGKPKERER